MSTETSSGVEKLNPKPLPRRNALRLLLGGSFMTFAASFVSPLLHYLVPRWTPVSAKDALAGLVGELKPKQREDLRLRRAPRSAGTPRQRRISLDVGGVYAPGLHGSVQAGNPANLVPLP